MGCPVKIDQHTFKVAHGKFAWVCVEIELSKPVVGMVSVEDS